MRSGLFLPPFDALADPGVVARLAAEAEEAGWQGVFVWDHVRWREPVTDVADAWITLAAIATATHDIRLGPMVTPLARRRPVKVARETATLDRLSDGRLTLGVALGSDRSGKELSITGEELNDRRRASMLDEALEILTAAWTGEPVYHRGEHYTVDGMRFLPRPVQRPGVPVWVGRYPGKAGPLRRAARYEGFFPVDLEGPDQLAEIVPDLASLRREFGKDLAEPYDVVAALPPGTDPAPYASAGATWWMVEFPWDGLSVDQVRGVIRDGLRQTLADGTRTQTWRPSGDQPTIRRRNACYTFGCNERNGACVDWILLTYRLPSEPCRYRVAVWREQRKVGAVPLQQATWALPARGDLRRRGFGRRGFDGAPASTFAPATSPKKLP